jgi:hypothetical protein
VTQLGRPEMTSGCGLCHDSVMNARSHRRVLIVSSITYGAVVGGRCSICHRPFEVAPGKTESLSAIRERLNGLFEAHTCDEDISQAASRVVRKAIDKG